MSEVKEKHPTWFKMKIERRQLIDQLPPKTAKKILLACFDYLETNNMPANLNMTESIAFSAIFPDLEEAWKKYEQRINAKAKSKSVDII